jgi:signal transduction histidine kinase
MTRILPRTLFGQTLAILLAGLILSQMAGAWIYLGARREAVRAVGGLAFAQRVANLTRLIQEAPTDWRDKIVKASSDPTFRLSIANKGPELSSTDADQIAAAKVIEDFLASELALAGNEKIRVRFRDTSPQFSPIPHPSGFGPGSGRGMMAGPMMHAAGAWRGLEVGIPLSDGRWLNITTALPESGPALSPQLILAIVVMATIVGLVATLAVRRLVAPLGALAAAADRIGRNVTAAPLAESGTVEMRQAAHALNSMQDRLRRLIENRTQMLAAISHDLRTELQLLRLRSETIEPAEDRERMLATIANMEAMVGATLNFARDDATLEPQRRTDLNALLSSIIDDMSDVGRPVTLLSTSTAAVVDCQPTGLRRALTNLIDNAIKYGHQARVSLNTRTDAVEIVIDDDGPGIPEVELGKVTQPFYRLDQSRNRDTGGMGLGLAIAQSAIQAQGGSLTLSNRTGGGLRATIALEN